MELKHGLIGAALAGLATMAGCTTNETLGRQQLLLVDNDQLAEPAMAAWQQTLKTSKVSADAEMNRRVKTVGARIVQAAGLSGQAWEYVVFDNPQPNAFVIPGNKVGVNSGLFKVVKNDDQLPRCLATKPVTISPNTPLSVIRSRWRPLWAFRSPPGPHQGAPSR